MRFSVIHPCEKVQKETWDPSILTLKKNAALRFQRNMEKASNFDLAYTTTPHLLTPYISTSLSTRLCALDRAGVEIWISHGKT